MAQLHQKLIFEGCSTQSQQAVKYEGQLALNQSFEILGQVAARDLFSEPSVVSGMSGPNHYMDKQKMQMLAGVPAPAQ